MKKNSLNLVSRNPDAINVGRFSFKSAFFIGCSLFLFSLVLPYFFWSMNLDIRPCVVFGNAFVTSFVIAYTRCFIDTKRGFGKSFWTIYLIFVLGIGFVGYAWLYLKLFI